MLKDNKRIVFIIFIAFTVLSGILGFCYWTIISLDKNFKQVENSYEIKNKISIIRNKLLLKENEALATKRPVKANSKINLDSLLEYDVKQLLEFSTGDNDKSELVIDAKDKIEEFVNDISLFNSNTIDSLSSYRIYNNKSIILYKFGLLEIMENENLLEYRRKLANSLQFTTWVVIISIFVTFFILALALSRILSDIEEKQNQIRVLENINHQKNRFFSVLGHDLKSPLGSFITLTEVLETHSGNLSSEDFSLYINMMKKSANNIFKLLDNLLQWSRLQMNYINFNPSIVEINSLIDNLIKQIEPNSSDKEILINTSYNGTYQVEADIWMLETIIRNLIMNAIKYSKRDGAITISTIKQKEKIIISIADHGIGMDQDKLKSIFNIEKRSSLPGTEKETGTGLGLLICKELVDKHGERIWASSELGKGTVFSFSMKGR